MITIRQILARKGERIVDVDVAATLAEAARMMARHGVGALAVREAGAIVGLLSERDLVLALAALAGDAATAQVGAAMQPVLDIDIDADLADGLGLMTDRRRRHLLVRQEGSSIGLVSIGDLVKAMQEEQAGTISSLHQYITG